MCVDGGGYLKRYEGRYLQRPENSIEFSKYLQRPENSIEFSKSRVVRSCEFPCLGGDGST